MAWSSLKKSNVSYEISDERDGTGWNVQPPKRHEKGWAQSPFYEILPYPQESPVAALAISTSKYRWERVPTIQT